MSDVRKQINYALTEHEFLRGFGHARRCNRKHFWSICCVIFVIVTLLNVDFIIKAQFDLTKFLSLNLIFIPCLLLAFFFLEIRRQKKIRANFRTSSFQRMEVTTQWDGVGLTVTNPDGFQIYRWSDFSGWAKDNLVITLLHTSGIYIPCPTRVFDEKQKIDFIQQMKDAGLANLKPMPF